MHYTVHVTHLDRFILIFQLILHLICLIFRLEFTTDLKICQSYRFFCHLLVPLSPATLRPTLSLTLLISLVCLLEIVWEQSQICNDFFLFRWFMILGIVIGIFSFVPFSESYGQNWEISSSLISASSRASESVPDSLYFGFVLFTLCFHFGEQLLFKQLLLIQFLRFVSPSFEEIFIEYIIHLCLSLFSQCQLFSQLLVPTSLTDYNKVTVSAEINQNC